MKKRQFTKRASCSFSEFPFLAT